MPSLEMRVQRIEEATASAEYPAFMEFVRSLPPLDEEDDFDWNTAAPAFRDAFRPWLKEMGSAENHRFRRLLDPFERGLALILAAFEDSSDPFAFERYRGSIPDRILAALYNERRNWVGTAETVQRVRQLAGVADEQGNVLPGYVLVSNGCILCADASVSLGAMQ